MLKYAFRKRPIENVSDVLWKMRRGLAGQNVSQRAPRVVLECVVLCVAVHDTSDTFLFRVNVREYDIGFTESVLWLSKIERKGIIKQG